MTIQVFSTIDRYRAASSNIIDAGSLWLLYNQSWLASFMLAELNIIRLHWRERKRYKWAEMQSTQITPLHLQEHTHTVHIPLPAIIQHKLHNSNSLWLCEIDFWGARPHIHPLRLSESRTSRGNRYTLEPAPPPDQHIPWSCQGRFLKKKKKKLLRWIQHDTLVMQQAASSEAMHREHSSSEKHKELQRTMPFSKVV